MLNERVFGENLRYILCQGKIEDREIWGQKDREREGEIERERERERERREIERDQDK